MALTAADLALRARAYYDAEDDYFSALNTSFKPLKPAATARANYDAEDAFVAPPTSKPLKPAAPPTETASTNSEYSSDAESEEINEQKIAPPAAVAEAPAVKTWREVLAPRLWSIATLAGIYACAPFVVGSWASARRASSSAAARRACRGTARRRS